MHMIVAKTILLYQPLISPVCVWGKQAKEGSSNKIKTKCNFSSKVFFSTVKSITFEKIILQKHNSGGYKTGAGGTC